MGRRVAGSIDAVEPVEVSAEETSTPTERINAALREIEEELRDELLERIFSIEDQTRRAAFFEELVVELLTAMGYGKGLEDTAQRIGGMGDGGVDGVIHLDALGIDRVYVQAKCYDRTTSIQEGQVRDFSGSLDPRKTTRGVFITTARFSEPARRYVQTIQKQIVLTEPAEPAIAAAQPLIGETFGRRTKARNGGCQSRRAIARLRTARKALRGIRSGLRARGLLTSHPSSTCQCLAKKARARAYSQSRPSSCAISRMYLSSMGGRTVSTRWEKWRTAWRSFMTASIHSSSKPSGSCPSTLKMSPKRAERAAYTSSSIVPA